jgi:hypothetical protein
VLNVVVQDENCLQLICLGFTSAKYKINLVKTHIAKHLDMDDVQNVFTIKRNNQYQRIDLGVYDASRFGVVFHVGTDEHRNGKMLMGSF